MAAGFNQAALQDHLQAHWGISKSHSMVPLCLAITAEPSSRLSDAESAKEFLNSLMPRYASYTGITLLPGVNNSGVVTAQATAVVDPVSLNIVKKEQRAYHLKQFELLAKYLQINPQMDNAKLEELAASEKELEEKLNHWHSEFDDHFFDGIMSLFDTRKGRKYDSWWNWAREDFLQMLHGRTRGGRLTEIMDGNDDVRRMLGRCNLSCLSMAEYAASEHTNPARQASIGTEEDIARLGARALEEDPVFKYTIPTMAPKTTIASNGSIEYTEAPRAISKYSSLVEHGRLAPSGEHIPFIHIRRRGSTQEWEYDRASTSLLLAALHTGSTSGITFTGKAVLVTGAGPNSIGAEVVRGLLCGGAKVVVTTSRTVSSTAKFYQQMYRKYGARNSALTVLPFNQGSKRDCEALIKHIYSANSPTGGELDFVVPFAAIPETGEIDNLDGKSEVAHRVMLVNVIRLFGLIRKEKELLGINTSPTTVVLPLSPNHGTFGGDGLYAESKLGLETLFNRFYSESWSTYLNICGAVIGWTRGTGLMNANNIVAEAIERHSVITFSQTEMAFNILALMTPEISAICEDDPVYANLNGGLQYVPNLKQEIVSTRARISDDSKLRKALLAEESRHQTVLKGANVRVESTDTSKPTPTPQRVNLTLGFPELSSYQDLTTDLKDLKGMVDLSRTVVVVGFSELGPWGNARTRWEMEHRNCLSPEGYVEMAWMMGLVKHKAGEVKGKPYTGWIDTKTLEPVKDDEFERKYHEDIMSHTGLRFIEPEGLGGYDPSRKEFLHEVAVEDDLPPFESSKATAEAFKLRYGDKVTIEPILGSDESKVHIRKGAHFLVPKSVPFDREVAGQLPRGWDPATYGIPKDIVQQVDPITLYALCCVSEALLSAGIQDPYELYKHMHVSEVANCLGTGAGSLLAMRGVYRDRYLDQQVQSDILQESFLNTMGAWVNMLLLSSTGPIKSPVGACATAIESLDIGCEAIQTGKSKMALVGGCDDLQEEMSYEFSKMKATASSTDELERGRLPKEMSRPSASSRNGFVESAGCGVQLIMSAEVALEMGLPIYGIVAYTQMASDKIGRSVPAPGKGILTAARETCTARDSHLLDIEYRRKNLEQSFVEIRSWRQTRLNEAKRQPGWSTRMLHAIDSATACKFKEAQRLWGNDIRLQDSSIAPITASLAAWGLTIDDIQVASMHGTSTKANDTNEADVINSQMTHLGRAKGNPLVAVCQKSLTGHPKGAAGAWQFNGCMKMLQTGIVPGNHNADNIDDHLRAYEHIVYPMEAVQLSQVRATMLTSFGFGQKGGVAIAVAPKYLFSVISEDAFEDYRPRVAKRQRTTDAAFQKALMSNTIFKAKDHSPWGSSDAALKSVLLNPASRVSTKGASTELAFNNGKVQEELTPAGRHELLPPAHPLSMSIDADDLPDPLPKNHLATSIQSMLESCTNRPSNTPLQTSVGVDVENVSDIPITNTNFLSQNFTAAERAYCSTSPNPAASLAGRWSAKEAVFKSMQVASRGPGAAMDEIEILSDECGAPQVMVCASPSVPLLSFCQNYGNT